MVNITKNEFKRKHRTETPSTRSNMVTLPNVETGRGQAKPPSVRLVPDTIPEAKSSRTGVSVRYAPFIIATDWRGLRRFHQLVGHHVDKKLSAIVLLCALLGYIYGLVNSFSENITT